MQGLQEHVVDGIRQKVAAAEEAPALPSRTHSAQQVKIALQKDPTNLELIYRLGHCYAVAGQWTQSRNVLLRGRDRLAELCVARQRFDFCMRLSEASYRCKFGSEAVAVFNSIGEVPEDQASRRAHAVVGCKAHCCVGDRQRALKHFCGAISGHDFDGALGAWALLRADLQSVDANASARKMLEQLANGEEDLSKLATLEGLADMGVDADVESGGKAVAGRWGLLLQRIRITWTTAPLRFKRLANHVAGCLRSFSAWTRRWCANRTLPAKLSS
mmetsp:Transcript_67164/g.176104  ORF Transcript_67164/g.176104 Transcript_67164/m.176104 type:complete len:273 (-) Transcript_67164:46-864(-)